MKTMYKVYEINGENFETLEGFYDEISKQVIPGVDWGRNLDAFNDILRGGFGTPEAGFVLKWKHHEISQERLGYPETIRQLEKRLHRCHPDNRVSVSRELERARQHIGETVFDWLIEIIQVHGEGGYEGADRVSLVLA